MSPSKLIIMILSPFLIAMSGYAATPKLHEKLGGQNLEILQNAKYVTILHIIPEQARGIYNPVQELHLNKEEVERLKRNLLDDHNYDFARQKNCLFNPEISFKFIDDKEQTLHVFISPSCNQILFGTGNRSVILNYDPAQERLEPYLQQLVAETRGRNSRKWGT